MSFAEKVLMHGMSTLTNAVTECSRGSDNEQEKKPF